ncbi:non-ribosomal peptide synthetase [Verrucomicrobiota bacterium sgz303538]
MIEQNKALAEIGSIEHPVNCTQKGRVRRKRAAAAHGLRETPPSHSPSDRQRIGTSWNDTDVAWPQHRCIHELFETQADRTPNAIAVSCQERQITYRELNRRANQLANHLMQMTSGMDVPIGLCVERSLEMVIGVLAILKSGAAYLPLDPTYPQPLLRHMIGHAVAPLILTKQRIATHLPENHARLLCIDTQPSGSEANPPRRTAPGNLACIFYTSGTTGTPKPVAVPHRSLVNLIAWYMGHPAFSKASRTAQFSSLSFHLSCQEMFSTWATGGTLVLIPEELRDNPEDVLDFLRNEQIERLFLPIVALQQLADAASCRGFKLSCLRDVVCTGGALQISPTISEFFGQLDNCILHNHYGTAEAHVATAYTLSGSPAMWPLVPPIGSPIANTKIYLLDPNFQPVAAGTPGEIYVSGECLSQGYLHRLNLTAEQFVSNPFSTDRKGRLYRTGDIARYRDDGCIEYIGRAQQAEKSASCRGNTFRA